jgi:hypothetical protein
MFFIHNYEVVGKMVLRSIPLPAQVEKHGSGALAGCPAHLHREQGQSHEILVGNIDSAIWDLWLTDQQDLRLKGLFRETVSKPFLEMKNLNFWSC